MYASAPYATIPYASALPELADYESEVLADTPHAFWPLNTENDWNDASGNGFHATPGTSTAEPIFLATGGPDGGGAIQLDDTNDQTLTGTTLGDWGLRLRQDSLLAWSVECWFRNDNPADTSQGWMLGTVNDGTSVLFYLTYNVADAVEDGTGTNPLGILYRENSGGHYDSWIIPVESAVVDIHDGEWHHIVATSTSDSVASIQFYVDGVTEVTENSNSAETNTADTFDYPLGIGINNARGTLSRFSDKSLTGVAIYNTLLSPSRVLAHYDAMSAEAPSPTASLAFGGLDIAVSDLSVTAHPTVDLAFGALDLTAAATSAAIVNPTVALTFGDLGLSVDAISVVIEIQAALAFGGLTLTASTTDTTNPSAFLSFSGLDLAVAGLALAINPSASLQFGALTLTSTLAVSGIHPAASLTFGALSITAHGGTPTPIFNRGTLVISSRAITVYAWDGEARIPITLYLPRLTFTPAPSPISVTTSSPTLSVTAIDPSIPVVAH